MILSAHQPAYNPWLGYLHKILISDKFVIMDDVQFEKNSFINRNKILFQNQEVMLTIPVLTKGYKEKVIKDIKIADTKWKIKHIKSIEQAYKKSLYYDKVFNDIKKIYDIKSNFLVDFIYPFMDYLIKYLEIKTPILFSSNFKIKSKKQDYILELCKVLNANLFVFGNMGRKYVDKKFFEKENIFVYFQEYKHPVYNQLNSKKFYPYLGVLDILFNEPKEKIKDIILYQNITKNYLKDFYVKENFNSSCAS